MNMITIKSTMRSLVIILLLGSFSQVAAQKQFALIANNDVPLESINKSTLKRVYNGFTTQWPGGLKAKPSYASEGIDSFWSYIGTTKTNFDRFWTKRVFSGNGVPPVEHASSAEVINYVSKISGAIGVVEVDDASNLPESCKLISMSD